MIDIQGILSMLPHRYPFLMVDRVLELEAGQRAVAIKCVSASEPAFQGHFPGRPIFPGVLIIECFAQVAGIVALSSLTDLQGRAVYLLGVDGARFRRPVTPGDRITVTVEKLMERRGIWRFSARAEVEGQRVAEAEIMATVARDSDALT